MESLVFREGTKEYELMQKIVNDKEYKFPITSSKENLMNKKVDYKVLMLMTLLSNSQPESNFLETGSEEMWRYLYRNKLTEYKELVESLSKTKLNSIYKMIKKMEKLDCKVINVRKTETNGIVYDINYTNNNREFVTIETRIMESLIHTCNSNSIKVYVLLKYMCRDGRKQISREWLLKQIGLSERSDNNLKVITDITDMLHLCGYINKYTERKFDKYVNYYEVNSLFNWKRIRKERLSS